MSNRIGGSAGGMPKWADTKQEVALLGEIRDARAQARQGVGDGAAQEALGKLGAAQRQLKNGNAERAQALSNRAQQLMPSAAAAALTAAPPAPAVAPAPAAQQQVTAELQSLSGELEQAKQLARKAGVRDKRVEQLAEPSRYLLNVAHEATKRGDAGNANALLGAARMNIASVFEQAQLLAGKTGKAGVAARAEQGSARARNDATPPEVAPGTTLRSVLDQVLPQSELDKAQNRATALRNRSNDARHQGMNRGADLGTLDARIERQANRAERLLAQGRAGEAHNVLAKGDKLLARAQRQAQAGGNGATALRLADVQAAYKRAQQGDPNDAGERFVREIVGQAGARAGGFERPREADQSMQAQLTRLFIAPAEADQTITDDANRGHHRGGNADKSDTAAPPLAEGVAGKSLDQLFRQVVTLIGGKGANEGHQIQLRDGQRGKFKGTMFDDTVSVSGNTKGALRIDTREGNDRVLLQDADARGAKIDLGRGNDSAALIGSTERATVRGGIGNDQIALAGPRIENVRIDAGDDADQVQIAGNIARSEVQLGAGSDALALNADASLARASAQNVKVSAGGGHYTGDDVIAIGGRVSGTQLDLSEDWRGHGRDVVQTSDTLRGTLRVSDQTHSTATWESKYLKHDDAVLLGGAGWKERGQATEAGNALVRKNKDGKALATIELGHNGKDGEIERIQTDAGERSQTLRDEQPELFSKPFGVTAGEWGIVAAKAGISAAIPGAAIVFAAGDMAMALDKGDLLGAGLAALGGAAGGLGVAAAGTAVPGSSTFIANAGQAAKSAASLSRAANTLSDIRRGVELARSFADGNISIGDVFDAASYGAGFGKGAGNASLQKALDYGGAIAGGIGKGGFDPSGLLAMGGAALGKEIRTAGERRQAPPAPVFGTVSLGDVFAPPKPPAVGLISVPELAALESGGVAPRDPQPTARADGALNSSAAAPAATGTQSRGPELLDTPSAELNALAGGDRRFMAATTVSRSNSSQAPQRASLRLEESQAKSMRSAGQDPGPLVHKPDGSWGYQNITLMAGIDGTTPRIAADGSVYESNDEQWELNNREDGPNSNRHMSDQQQLRVNGHAPSPSDEAAHDLFLFRENEQRAIEQQAAAQRAEVRQHRLETDRVNGTAFASIGGVASGSTSHKQANDLKLEIKARLDDPSTTDQQRAALLDTYGQLDRADKRRTTQTSYQERITAAIESGNRDELHELQRIAGIRGGDISSEGHTDLANAERLISERGQQLQALQQDLDTTRGLTINGNDGNLAGFGPLRNTDSSSLLAIAAQAVPGSASPSTSVKPSQPASRDSLHELIKRSIQVRENLGAQGLMANGRDPATQNRVLATDAPRPGNMPFNLRDEYDRARLNDAQLRQLKALENLVATNAITPAAARAALNQINGLGVRASLVTAGNDADQAQFEQTVIEAGGAGAAIAVGVGTTVATGGNVLAGVAAGTAAREVGNVVANEHREANQRNGLAPPGATSLLPTAVDLIQGEQNLNWGSASLLTFKNALEAAGDSFGAGSSASIMGEFAEVGASGVLAHTTSAAAAAATRMPFYTAAAGLDAAAQPGLTPVEREKYLEQLLKDQVVGAAAEIALGPLRAVLPAGVARTAAEPAIDTLEEILPAWVGDGTLTSDEIVAAIAGGAGAQAAGVVVDTDPSAGLGQTRIQVPGLNTVLTEDRASSFGGGAASLATPSGNGSANVPSPGSATARAPGEPVVAVAPTPQAPTPLAPAARPDTTPRVDASAPPTTRNGPVEVGDFTVSRWPRGSDEPTSAGIAAAPSSGTSRLRNSAPQGMAGDNAAFGLDRGSSHSGDQPDAIPGSDRAPQLPSNTLNRDRVVPPSMTEQVTRQPDAIRNAAAPTPRDIVLQQMDTFPDAFEALKQGSLPSPSGLPTSRSPEPPLAMLSPTGDTDVPPDPVARPSVADGSPIPPSVTEVASGTLSRSLGGVNVNATLRALIDDVLDPSSPLPISRFTGAYPRWQIAQVRDALSNAGIDLTRAGEAAPQVVALARELNVDPVQLAQQLATRLAQDQAYLQGITPQSPLVVDGQASPRSVQPATDYLTKMLARAVEVPPRTMTLEGEGGQSYDVYQEPRIAQTAFETDIDGVFEEFLNPSVVNVSVMQRDGTVNYVDLPLGDQQLPGNPVRLHVLQNADAAVVEFEAGANQRGGVVLPITPEVKAVIQRGDVIGLRPAAEVAAAEFPPSSAEFLQSVSETNVRTGGELTGGVVLPSVKPNSMRTIDTPFQGLAGLSTTAARMLPPGEVSYPAPEGWTFLPGVQTRQVEQPKGLFGLPGLTVNTGGTATTRGSTTQFFALNPTQQQAMRSVAEALPRVVDDLSAEYGLPDDVRAAWKSVLFANPEIPDIPTLVLPEAVTKVFDGRTQASHPDRLLSNLQGEIEQRLIALVDRYDMGGFINLHHTPAARTATSDDAVAYKLTPEQEAQAIAEAAARGETYKPKVTTDWVFATHSQKGMAVLDGVVTKLNDVYGIDLKAELERTGHPYSALLEMKMPEFEQFVQDTIRPMIDQLGVKLGQVVVAGDTYLETNGQLAGTDASMARVAAKLYGLENTTVLQVSTTQGEPGPRQLFETNVDERGHANVTTPSVDPSGRNGDLAPKVLVKRQAEMGQIARDAYNAQLPLSASEVDAMRNRGSVSQGPKLPESVSFAGVDEQGAVQFTPKQLAAMQEAAQGDGQVWMSSYSSTGGGHTERLLGPVADAVKPGDVVVLYLPLPWESDTGGAAGTLKKYLGELHDKGAVTIIAQSDRTITGLYDKPTGKSDNPRILDNFVNSLNPPKAIDKDILDNRNVPTFAADALVGKVVEAVGDKNKIKVVSDMGINLTNAAEKAGIPFRLEIGNHQGNLIVPSLNAQGDRRWDGFLQLATAGSQTAIGSVSYSNKINPLPTMKATLDSADFNASMTPAAAQQLAIKTLYEKGVRLPLNEAGENDTPGVLMAPGAKLSDLDSVVALYVNAYTPQVVRHIKEQLNRGNSDYQNTLFLVAGRKAMRNPDTDPNALHLAYVHGDMLMNAGYGTTSEADYLKQVAGHQGQFVIMPVQRQHEQEQNAVVMKERLGDDVQIAEDPDQLIRTLDELMPNRTTTQSLEDRANDPSGPPESKTMQRFLDALGDDSTMRKSLAELAAGRRTMTLEEDRLNTLSANPYALSDGLTQRRLLYLAWPALKATLKGEPSFTSQVSRDLPPMQFDNLQELANVLEDDSALEQTLGLEELGTRQSRDVRRYLQDAVHDLLNTPNPVERKLKARDYMADLGERFNLGY